MGDIDFVVYDELNLHDIESDTTNSCYQFPCKHARNDEILYQPGTEEYKKARKRRQNRESAVRIRARKKIEECHIYTTLDVLKENTSKLKLQNASLKSENEMLKKQIALFKKLTCDTPKFEEAKVTKQPEIGETKGEPLGRGKRLAGLGIAITLVCIFGVMRVEDSQPINTGGRSLAFVGSELGLQPIFLTVLIVISGFLLNILILR